jgi:spermidine synthase
VSFGTVAVAVGAALLALAAMARRRPARVAGFATAAMGFTSIGLEMLVLLAFQAVYGYVYRQLAVVIAAFMAGMALGAWLGMRGRGGMRVLAATQALAAAAPPALLGLAAVAGPGAFPALALASGMLGGYEFSLASRIFPEGKGSALYALDLAGSCVGAVLLSAWFVPVFGFLKTALLMSLVNLAPAAAAIATGGFRRTPAR